MMRKTTLTCLAVALLLVTAGPAFANEAPGAKDYVKFSADDGRLYWEQLQQANGFEVVVTDPNGRESASWTFKSQPTLSLDDLSRAFSELPDGCYSWDINAELALDSKTLGQLNELRNSGQPLPVWWYQMMKDTHQSGTFWIVKGNIVFDTKTEDTPDRLTANTDAGALDGVTMGVPGGLDLQSIQESLCVGFDCLANESFSFDTVRLKENNLRIHFDDTSTAGSYPNQDWRIEINSSVNGGAEYFRVIDATANRNIFTIEANAPNDSLVVDNSGRLGVKTANPSVELHVSDGDSPTLRLDQTNASGFNPQRWDVAGNETSFFIRDATNGSTLPFRIRPGSPSNALVIDTDGEIGIGTITSDAKLDINGVDAGTSAISMDFGNSSTGVTWFFQNDQDETFKISREASGGAELILRERNDASGDATLFVDGSIEADNVMFSSSRELKTAFNAIDPVEVLERLAGIPILEWRYKNEDEGIKHMGPVAEEFMAAFELGRDERQISVTDINGVALAAIQGLHQENRELRQLSEEQLQGIRQENQELRQMNEALLRRLEALEARLSDD